MSGIEQYRAMIQAKRIAFVPRGMEDIPPLNSALKDHQRHSVEFALKAGCAALFLDTGLGKTLCALEWGRVVVERTGRPVLMLAPLAVAAQHEREAVKFGIDAKAIREPEQIGEARIYITNYDRLGKFDPSLFSGVILDESSILKSFTGSTTRALMEAFRDTPFRLCCSATPAPNDHMELGQHCQFLGVMNSNEMLARWFIADQKNMGRYRIKHPAKASFWEWVASWARCVSKPSDLGFDDAGYDLPDLIMKRHIVAADRSINAGEERDGQALLFRMPDTSATSIHREKRLTIEARAEVIAGLVANEPGEPWLIWCDTDYEADALTDLIPAAIEVRGSMSPEVKEQRLTAFATGQARILITKPSIAGQGLNLQHCARMAFVGLSFSYEAFYQAVRRCHRFGQVRSVQVHVACADTEESVWQVVNRKSGDHEGMKREMSAAMRRSISTSEVLQVYRPAKLAALPAFLGAA